MSILYQDKYGYGKPVYTDLNAQGILMNFYLFIKVNKVNKAWGVHWCMKMYGNTESALTTESLYGYLPNLVGIKYSWPPHICIDFWVKSAQGGSRAGP